MISEKNIVQYQGKDYYLIHKYDSGFCEIQEKASHFHIELVHILEITIKEDHECMN